MNPEKSTVLTLVRHAEVEAPYQGIFGGVVDMNLSPRGHQQAAALAKYFLTKKFDALYASPMKRVQQTLAPLMVNGTPRPTILPGLREVDFGDWTGMPWDTIETKYGKSPLQWLDHLEHGGIPNAETAESLRARVEPCLRQMLDEHAHQQIAVICHGGVIRMFLAILLNWRLSQIATFELQYASLTQVAVSGERAQLQLLNFTPWREIPQ